MTHSDSGIHGPKILSDLYLGMFRSRNPQIANSEGTQIETNHISDFLLSIAS